MPLSDTRTTPEQRVDGPIFPWYPAPTDPSPRKTLNSLVWRSGGRFRGPGLESSATCDVLTLGVGAECELGLQKRRGRRLVRIPTTPARPANKSHRLLCVERRTHSLLSFLFVRFPLFFPSAISPVFGYLFSRDIGYCCP